MPPSVFAALEDAVSSACDDTFGESWELRPIAAPTAGARQPDPARTIVTVTGIYEAPLYKSTEFGSEARGSMPALMERPTLSVDRRALATPPKRLDRALRLGTGDLYEISSVERDAEGRYKLGLKHIGAA